MTARLWTRVSWISSSGHLRTQRTNTAMKLGRIVTNGQMIEEMREVR
jgi:hypothetical protein